MTRATGRARWGRCRVARMKVDVLAGRIALTLSIGCAGVIAVTAATFVSPTLRAALKPGTTGSYAIGQAIDLPPSAYADAPHTLILFAQSECAACQRAQPFLSVLTARMGEPSAVRFRVAMETVDDRSHANSLAY